MTPRITRFRGSFLAVATVLVCALTCAPLPPASDRGALLVRDPGLAASAYNVFACTTCHAVPGSVPDDRILPGAPLAGATLRPNYWGGAVVDLRDAVEICFQTFMRAGSTRRDDVQWDAIYAYLDSIASVPGAVTTAVPFNVPRTVGEPGPGDAARGADTYRRACQGCHGEAHTGVGRLAMAATISIIPNDTEQSHRAPAYNLIDLRTIIVQKTRHGSFLGFAGTMPPFSTDVLAPRDVDDIVAFLNPELRL